MDLSALDTDFFTRTSSFTKTFHRDVYPSIDPSSPSLSQQGKIVIVTGAGSGIGARGFAPAFAQAGARVVVLVGRRLEKLQETAAALRKEYSGVEVLEAALSIADADAVAKLYSDISAKYGASPDVLINNAGQATSGGMLGSAQDDASAWWNDFEISVRGAYLMTHYFLKSLGPEKAGTVIGLTSFAASNVMPGTSSYSVGKVALVRLLEFVATESPQVTAIALDPGTVATDMVPEPMRKFALDTPRLVGGAAVWLSTPQAKFLSGKTVGATWSVDELLARKDEIETSGDLKFALKGKFGAAA